VDLWIDVLCINQSNMEERSQQVGIMGEGAYNLLNLNNI
jgi:hypothetical protein